MSPFGLEALPAEVLTALRTVPLIAERLDEVARHTSVLHEIHADVQAIRDRVAEMEQRVATIEAGMEPVTRLADKMPGSGPR